jgi:hypothetical protein
MNFLKPIVLALVIAFACFRLRERKWFGWFRQLTGWQKVFGVLAVIAAVVIVANPEFICLGLLGDATFFDLLVLGLTLQLHGLAARFWRSGIDIMRRAMKWLNVPSPGFAYLMAMLTFIVASVCSIVQKVLNRLS